MWELPGAGFGENGEGYFRLTAFGDKDNTVEAMNRLKSFFGFEHQTEPEQEAEEKKKKIQNNFFHIEFEITSYIME